MQDEVIPNYGIVLVLNRRVWHILHGDLERALIDNGSHSCAPL